MASSTSSSGGILGANGTTNFVPGLASGMDTEDMVEKLLSGTQAKIDKQNAKMQQIEWKQEIYRDTITKINSFQDKYFSFFGTNNTNLLSSSFYNVMSASSTSSAVKVTSAKSSAASNMVINSIKQLATAAKGESAAPVTGEMKGAITSGAFPTGTSADKTYSFDMSLDGVRKTIKFKGDDDQTTLIKNINNGIKKVFGDTVAFDNDMKLNFKKIQVPKTDAQGNVTMVEEEDNSHRVILYNSADASDDTVTDGVLGNLGFKNGASNKLDYNTYLDQIPFSKKLQGKNFTFTINGTEIKASTEDTLGDVINRINNSEAEVRVTYSSVKDKFVIESANTGADISIDMSQSEGNLLTAMFGIEGGGGVGGTVKGLRNSEKITAEKIEDPDAFQAVLDTMKSHSSAFALTVNGKVQTVEIPKNESGYADTTKFTEALNEALKKKFGTNASGQSNVQINLQSNGGKDQFEIVSNVGYKVSFSEENVENSIAGQMGFQKDSVQDDIKAENTTLEMLFAGKDFLSANINIAPSTTIQLDKTTTLQQLMDKIKASLGPNAEIEFDAKTGEMSITGVDDAITISASGDGKEVLKTLFGQEQLEINQSGTPLDVTTGKNAILTVNGTTNEQGKLVGATTIERNTNTFELDGITMELTATTAAGAPPINLTTSKDTDKIVEGLKGFVDDYNALIEELNTQINAEASFQKYAPLTDAQKKEMSEREIENWEKKAKEGLLRNDSNISKFLQEMRAVMYKTVDSAGLALYDIGIESSSNYRDNGKLVLDENKLNSALTTNLDGIEKLFTDKDNGIAVQLQNTLKAAANPSSGSPGSLVRYAGTKDVMVTSNTLYNEMKGIKETLSKLNTKYSTERTRYWKQFTQMEQAISKMNSQSSWLTQQFS